LIFVGAGQPPPDATGFDVYAGESPEALTLQTLTPVAAGQFWSMPISGLISGTAPPADQKPDHYVRRNRTR
jgi:hypothetical protein